MLGFTNEVQPKTAGFFEQSLHQPVGPKPSAPMTKAACAA